MLATITQILRNWTLPIAMVAGAIGYPFFIHLTPLLPWLIFAMLTITFCRVSATDIRISTLHWVLLAVQVLGAIGVFYALKDIDVWIAEGAMICFIAPTATAAAVITEKLGGSAASLTAFTMVSNIGCAVTAPALFPLIHPAGHDISYWMAVLTILQKVFPLLIFPFFVAMAIKCFTPTLHRRMMALPNLAFYLWAVTITILMGQVIATIINEQENLLSQIWIALAALTVCGLQFWIGKVIGARWNQRITGGQALGQKNTVFAIWLAHTYMTPITAVGAGSYVIWQNVINASQLWLKQRERLKGDTAPANEDPA
jgi:BASS family bile acid:Na+ symporter